MAPDGKAREHGADVLSCSDNPSGEACKRGQAENKAYAAALATSSVSLLPRSAQAMWALGAGANAGIGSMVDSSVDPENAIIAGWVNVITMGQGWKGTVGWNAAGGAFGNWLDGKDPLSGAAMSGGTSAIGYGVGKVVQGPLEKVINPNWKNWEWLNVGMGISKPLPLNPTPGIAGNIGSSIGSEGSGAIIQEQLKKSAGEEIMKCQSLLMRFLVTVLIWFIAIFIMSVMMFFFIRVFAFYWIGGDFLFSYIDVMKSLKIAVYCSLLCSIGSWGLYRSNKKNNR
ncbi:hypothetical protein ACVTM4_22475 [Escherichia coli]